MWNTGHLTYSSPEISNMIFNVQKTNVQQNKCCLIFYVWNVMFLIKVICETYFWSLSGIDKLVPKDFRLFGFSIFLF
jgi:hypothetical protein